MVGVVCVCSFVDLRREEYFMSVAVLSAARSKDPNKQVGACIVNLDNKIVGTQLLNFSRVMTVFRDRL